MTMNHSGTMEGRRVGGREGMQWNGNICGKAGIQQLRSEKQEFYPAAGTC
jgi:hypothetical protein